LKTKLEATCIFSRRSLPIHVDGQRPTLQWKNIRFFISSFLMHRVFSCLVKIF
jgi:hypothetical protein